ncbi:hypothetical protein QUB61_23170 [Microcoleus sp. C2D2]
MSGSSATDSLSSDVTDVTDVTDVRKFGNGFAFFGCNGCNGCNGCQEEGRNSRFQIEPGNAFHCCYASSFLRGGRASRNSFLGRAKERDNESRNERFLRAGRARVKFIPWQSQGTRETGK